MKTKLLCFIGYHEWAWRYRRGTILRLMDSPPPDATCRHCGEFHGRPRMPSWLIIVAYLIAIVLSNLLVATYGPVMLLVTAWVLIPFDFVTRDILHERWEGPALWWRMASLILTGGLLSIAINAGAAPIAIASFIAFTACGFLDTLIYSALWEHSKMVRMNVSNLAVAFADSLIFPLVAFGVLDWRIVVWQNVSKAIGAAVWTLLLVKALKLR